MILDSNAGKSAHLKFLEQLNNEEQKEYTQLIDKNEDLFKENTKLKHENNSLITEFEELKKKNFEAEKKAQEILVKRIEIKKNYFFTDRERKNTKASRKFQKQKKINENYFRKSGVIK